MSAVSTWRGATRAAVVAAVLCSAAVASAETMKVTVNRANLRAQPRTGAEVTAVLDEGTEVEILERDTDFWKVRVVATGLEGYLNPVFLGVGMDAPKRTPRRRTAARRTRAPAPPRDYARFRLDLGGAFGASGTSFTDDRTITEYVEEGRIETSYATDPGPGFEGGLLFRFTRHLGLGVGVSRVQHDGGADFNASIPHPLYFERHREASGSMDNVAQKETAVHLDVVYSATRGKMDLHFFGGPTWMTIGANVLSDLEFTETYPFNSITVTGTPALAATESGFGFNVGAGLDYRVGRSFAIGGQVRFSRAKAELLPVPDSPIEVQGGGLQVGLGARLLF